jgi:hypothetical protein
MAWSSSFVDATDRARYEDDKPLLAYPAVFPITASNRVWVYTGDFTDTPSFDSDSDYPVARAWDLLDHWKTQAATARTVNYIYLGPSTSLSFDCIGVFGLDWTGTGLQLLVDIADDSAFTTNKQTIAAWTPSGNPSRLFTADVSHTGNARSYSGVDHIRFKFIAGAAQKFPVGEIFLGTRAQLYRYPDAPFQTHKLEAGGFDVLTVGRGGFRSTFHGGRRSMGLSVPADTGSSSDDLDDLYTNTAGGLYPMIWAQNPFTDANRVYWVSNSDGSHVGPRTLPYRREFSLNLVETSASLVADEEIE